MTERKTQRSAAIAEAAYEVLAEKGYGGASMLTIARRARASNETLYRWYGDKTGLFAELIRANTAEIEAALDAGADLDEIGPRLLSMLVSERAIALNRAAAADPTGSLGALIGREGRERIAPRLRSLVAIGFPEADPETATARYLDLLVGDMQIRRVIGTLPEPAPEEIARRAAEALQALRRLLG